MRLARFPHAQPRFVARLRWVASAWTLALLFAGCGSSHEPAGPSSKLFEIDRHAAHAEDDDLSTPASMRVDAGSGAWRCPPGDECDCGSATAPAIVTLENYCGSCHRSGGTAPTSLEPVDLIASGLIVVDDPYNSRLFERMENGTMPPLGSPRPTAREIDGVRNWIACGAEVWNQGSSSTPRPTYKYPYESCEPAEQRIEGVLTQYCSSCHGPGSAGEGGFSTVLDRDAMVRQHWLVPYAPARSSVWRRIADGSMPPAGSPALSKKDAEMVLGWVQCGAPAFEASAGDAGPRAADDAGPDGSLEPDGGAGDAGVPSASP
jgi:mono/diheme cytochrome c family protein